MFIVKPNARKNPAEIFEGLKLVQDPVMLVTGNILESLEEAGPCCGKPTERCHQWSPA